MAHFMLNVVNCIHGGIRNVKLNIYGVVVAESVRNSIITGYSTDHTFILYFVLSFFTATITVPDFDDDDDNLLSESEPQLLMIIDKDGLPRYLCPKCNAKYKDPRKVKYHLRECGIRAECPICKFVCAQRRYLRDHMMTHNKQSAAYRRRKTRNRSGK